MDESCFILLSALQHYAFCPRQCALIHLEQVWADNGHTAEGSLMHHTAHSGESRTRDGIKTVTDLPLRCRRLGMVGQADVVEFHKTGAAWLPYPVEYKKGHPHRGCDADEVQLCAQALCLEEMLHLHIPEGALFYGQTRRRHVVCLDAALRERTEAIVRDVHALFASGITPPPEPRSTCDACSLCEYCMPDLTQHAASRYIAALCEMQNDDAIPPTTLPGNTSTP